VYALIISWICLGVHEVEDLRNPRHLPATFIYSVTTDRLLRSRGQPRLISF
jgi:hypothetical protein